MKHLAAIHFNRELGPHELTSEDKAELVKRYPDILTGGKT
jgi:hypothetical protein